VDDDCDDDDYNDYGVDNNDDGNCVSLGCCAHSPYIVISIKRVSL